MTDDFSPDILTLSGEDGKSTEFEVLDIIDYEGKKFYILLPRFQDQLTALRSNADYLVLLAEQDEDETFFSVPDEKTNAVISCIFEERYEKSFYDD